MNKFLRIGEGKCICKDSLITIRNKETSLIETVSIESFKNTITETN